MSKKIRMHRSPIHGNGVFAARDLPANSKVMAYRGAIITHARADKLYADTLETGHTFLFSLNARYVIDGNVGGNVVRWINHSCDPNCEAVLWEDPDGNQKNDQVVIQTLRAIKEGDELTYDYGIVLQVPHTARLKKIWACRCGAAKCIGTMLKPKRAKKAG
jgi:SET domain-containing protein